MIKINYPGLVKSLVLRRLLLFIPIILTLSLTRLQGASTGEWEWAWMKGSNIVGTYENPITAVYGTQGVADPANTPGACYEAISWVDNSGMFWLFGGYGNETVPNVLWKYDPTTNQWTWMKGATDGWCGIYGTQGVADPANSPGARSKAVSWTDGDGNLWLFGGEGAGIPNEYGNCPWGWMNDLWKYDLTKNQWTWMKGSGNIGESGIYGTQGVADPANTPGARYGSASWTDNSGNLWLFSGWCYDEMMSHDWIDDLWKYDISTGNWVWISGGPDEEPGGNQDTQETNVTTDMPGGRSFAVTWTDSNGMLWLFGGTGSAADDLWKYDPGTNVWTLVKGSTTWPKPAVHGTMETPDPANTPGAREGDISWTDKDDNLWLFGGSGQDSEGSYGSFNDLWKYDPATNQWTWMKGSDKVDQPGICDTWRVPASANTPGARKSAVSWIDNNNALWLFGGSGWDINNNLGDFNDVWKCTEYYNPPTDKGHQGSLTVTLGPADALAAGARWRIDEQAWNNSGDTLSLASGLYQVNFKEITGWHSPDSFTRVIAAGDNASLHFEYEPLEMYEIGEVPPVTVHHGETVSFRVNCDSITVENKTPATPVPVFDPVSKIFSYTSGENDREEFQVTFHATGGRSESSQAIPVQPLADLPAEQSILLSRKPAPDPASSDYLVVSDLEGVAAEDFNHTSIKTYDITVTGKTVLIEEGYAGNSLFEQYNGRRDIKSFTIFAEDLLIRSPFHLPQTEVTIYARRIKFDDKVPESRAAIITTPMTDSLQPAAGVDGKDGLKAGTIRVHIERISDTAGGRRFILKGGDGQQAGSGARPGDGGDGGDFYSNYDVSLFAYVPGGRSGAMDSLPALKEFGDPGTVTIDDDPLGWLRPEFIRAVLLHVKDAYLNDNLDYVQDVMTEYLGIIDAYEGQYPAGTENEFTQLHSEVQNLAHRAGNNLDYFGNPPGWVPMLSFEVNMALYENEIERAIKVLYLTYWLKNADQTRQEKVDALTSARDRMREEITDFQERYDKAQALIPGLEVQQQKIISDIEDAQQELKDIEKGLLERAKKIVTDRHKVPTWKKCLRVASVVCKMLPIPAVQPALAAIGTGMDLATRIDINKPMESFAAIAGAVQSFDGAGFKLKATSLLSKIKSMVPPENLDHTNAGDWFNQLGDTAKSLSNELVPIKDILKKTEAPKNEIEAELLKIKATDPFFHEVVDRIRELNIEKEIYARQLAEAMQLVTMMANGITQNLLAIDATSVAISENLEQQNHEAMQYVREMERRAWDRLLKYRYYMMKAYEYRFLKPCPGERNLEHLFTKFAELIAAGGDPLTLSDYTVLKAAYYDDVDEVIMSIVDELNNLPPEKSRTYGVSLTENELKELNEENRIVINLKNRGDSGLSHTEQNIRIVDLETISGGIIPKEPGGAIQEVDIEYEHSGLSRLEWQGKVYLFTHGNTNPDKYIPLTWKSTYKALSPEPYWEHHELSEAGQSLVRFLMERAGVENDNIMRYSRPAAWADITIKKSRGAGMKVESLVFDVEVDYFAKTDTGKSTLAIHVNDGLMPRILVDKKDINERQDGDGTFYRTFYRNDQITLTAPVNYGTWQFDQWAQSAGGNQMIDGKEYTDCSKANLTLLSTGPSIDLDLSDNMNIYAKYIQSVTGLSAPLVSGTDSPTTETRPTWRWWSGGGSGEGMFRYGWTEGTWIAEDVSDSSYTPGTDLPDGTHILYVQERDDLSNWSDSGTYSILVGGPKKSTMIKDFILGNTSDPKDLDVNGDGKIDVADIIKALIEGN